MSQIKITTDSFNLISQWRCSTGSNGTRFIVEGPTTVYATKSFAFSLPTGAIVNYVRVYATLGSPLTGAAAQTANNVWIGNAGYAEQDLASFNAASGSYSVTFAFRANGAVYADANYHSGTMSFSDVYLLIDYTVPNSAWSIGVSEVAAGRSATINIQPHDATCSHELLVTFGTLSKTYAIAPGITTYRLDVPYEWLAEIPNSTSGVATLKLRTLLNGVELGLSEPFNLTILCPDDVMPVIGSVATEIVNPVWGLCLQHHSSARLVLRNCSGAYGSTIRYGSLRAIPNAGNYVNTVDANTVEFEFVDALTVTGMVNIDVSITDSRGRTVTASTTIDVRSYSGPSITQTAQGRANSTGVADPQGTYVYAGVVYSYTALGANNATVQILYREDGASDWILGYEGNLASGQSVRLGAMFDAATVYEIKYVVADALSSTSVIRTIGTAFAFMKWMPRTNAIGFGCIPAGGNRVQIGQDWTLYIGAQSLLDYIKSVMGDTSGYEFVVDANGNCTIGSSTFTVDASGNATI